MNKFFLALYIVVSTATIIFADTYQISEVTYNITGKTKQYALEKKVEIDKNYIFTNEDDLINYIDDFKQRLENTRNFELIEVNFSLEKENSSETNESTKQESAQSSEVTETVEATEADSHYFVHLEVSTKDAFHFIGAPYPNYDSNNGFKFKLKLKDVNFIGTMETMNSDINFAVEQTSEDAKADVKLGFNIDFAIPFKMGPFDSSFVTALDFSYTFGDKTPEWDMKAGLELSLPFDRFSLDFQFYQSFVRDLDYEDDDINGTLIHYGDGTYFKENFEFSVPLVLQEIPQWGKIYYKPYISINYYWDFDGISDQNTDLMGPAFSIGHTLYTSRINWVENFRTGIDASMSEELCYNIQKENISPCLSGELKLYHAFKYLGLCADIFAFACLNDTKTFGGRLRGVRDDAYYNSDNAKTRMLKECEGAGAIVLNLDMPIRLFRIYWDKIPGIKKIRFMRYLNMEVQASPFIDFALSQNRANNTVFSIKDAFLTGGMELIVYPLKWRGIQIRGSIGLDLAQKMPGIKKIFNQEWRDSHWYEISIGIGLQY